MWKTPLLLIVISALSGCATPHDFKPTLSAEEVSSEREIIALCSSYQIQGEYTETASAGGVVQQTVKPVSVEALKPWLKCFETALRRFDSLRSNSDFAMFFHALQNAAGYDLNSPDLRFNWLAFNRAIRILAEYFLGEDYDYASESKNKPVVFSEEERLVLEKSLPAFLAYWQNRGLQNVSIRDFKLRAKLSPAQHRYCSKWQNLQMLKSHLGALDQYRKEIVGSKTEATQLVALDKLQERRLQILSDIKKMDPELAHLRGTVGTAMNSNSMCFEKDGVR